MKSIMKQKLNKRFWRLSFTTSIIIFAIMFVASVSAYGPSTMYTPPKGAPAPGALYGRAMQASDGSMYATFEQYTTGTPVFPIYKSTNSGQTWTQVGSVSDTHNGYGMRYQPFLYQLPQAIGSLAAGTLLCAGNSIPSSLASTEIDIYYSTNSGVTWTYLSTVAKGGEANPDGSYNPVWEPFLMVYNNQLVCYYSDERDKPAHNQLIGHETSSDGINWNTEVYDVALADTTQRPGMPVISRMPNGQYIMTYELMGLNGAYYQISSNPESWNVTSDGTKFDNPGSPFCTYLNGEIILSSSNTNNLFVSNSNGTGTWTQIASTLPTGYSRSLVALSNGRLFEISGGPLNGTANTVQYADMAITNAYYKFENVADSDYLDTYNNTAAGSAVYQYSGSTSYNQQWNIIPQSDGYFKIQSRATGLYLDTMGRTASGSVLAQNTVSTSIDQEWQIVPNSGYLKIYSRANGLYIDDGALTAPSTMEMWPLATSKNQEWNEVTP